MRRTMMRLVSVCLFLSSVVGCGSAQSPPGDAATILLAAHAKVLQAHLDRDPNAWTALEADTVLVGSRGDVFAAGRAERLERRRAYLGRTHFSVYRDLQPPHVHVSQDGTAGWLLAQVEVAGTTDEAGSAPSSFQTVWAWVELYERRGDRWLMTGNVSSERTDPTP